VSQLEAFVLTIVIEMAVALGIMAIRRQPPTVRFVVAVVLGSVVTHPLLWAVAPFIPVGWWWPAIGALEVVIGVVEGVVVVVVEGVVEASPIPVTVSARFAAARGPRGP